MIRRVFFRAGVLTLALSGCATESTTPPTAHYLQAGPSPQFAEQVEVLKGTLIQLRGGDILLEAQAQLIDEAVGVQFYVINLSDHAIRLEAKDFSLRDARGSEARLFTIKEMLRPMQARAAELEDKSQEKSEGTKTADAVVNPGNGYNGGSTNERLAKSLRGETKRFEKNLEPPFAGALLPANKKIGGIVYFEPRSAWPVELRVHAGDQTLAAFFYRAVVNP